MMKIRLIVPHANSNESPVQAYGKDIADIAEGFTAFEATGGWIATGDTLIVEPVTVFDCTTEEVDGYRWQRIGIRFRTLAKQIATERKQKCVYLEIDGEVEYVTQ